MTDGNATDPSSEFPESSHDETKATEDGATSEEAELLNEEGLTAGPGILDIINAVYNDRYYWEIFKSTVVFILALKVARECNMMKIPIKEYKPFNRC